MKSTRWRKLGTLGLALAGCLALAACSKGKSEGKSAKAPTPAAGSANANPGGPEGAKTTELGKASDDSAKADDKADDKPAVAAKTATKPDPDKKMMAPAKKGAPSTTKKAPVKADKPTAEKPKVKTIVRKTATHIVTVTPSPGSGGGAFTVSLKPTPGWKINMDFPTSLKIAAPAGVKIPKASMGKGDAAKFGEKAAAFKVKFGSSAGAQKFNAVFKFAMCTEATCDPKKETLAFVVDVK